MSLIRKEINNRSLIEIEITTEQVTGERVAMKAKENQKCLLWGIR